MAKDLEKWANTNKVEYFLISFVDLFGALRAKLVPTRAIKGCKKKVPALQALPPGST